MTGVMKSVPLDSNSPRPREPSGCEARAGAEPRAMERT